MEYYESSDSTNLKYLIVIYTIVIAGIGPAAVWDY